MSFTKSKSRSGGTGKESAKGSRRDSGSGEQAPFSQQVDDLQEILIGIPDRPAKSLMTFEELKAKIGSAPKKDRLGGLYKMSTRYKAIGQKLEAVKQALARATIEQIADQGGREQFESALNDQLDEVVAAGKRYQKKHTGKKGRAVQELLDDVERFREEIPRTLDALTDGNDQLPDGLSVDQAIVAKRSGIKPGQLKGVSLKHCEFTRFNDETRQGDTKQLGKGAVNTVHAVTTEGVERVFKEEQQTDTSQAWAPGMMGINFKDDPRYGNRNVAGGILGKLLGTSVMPDSRFAVNEGKVGLLMDKAPGKTLKDLREKGELDTDSFSSKAKASLQQQLMDMEVCDILTGQTDRHRGNYMIDVQGDKVTVTGIDNDFSFPDVDNVDESYVEDKNGTPLVLKFGAMNSIKTLPVLMSKTIADKISGIDFDRDIAPEWEGLLKEPEIRAAQTRFQALADHVGVLRQTGCIVADWEKWRSPRPDQLTATEYLEQAGKGSSLYERDFSDII